MLRTLNRFHKTPKLNTKLNTVGLYNLVSTDRVRVRQVKFSDERRVTVERLGERLKGKEKTGGGGLKGKKDTSKKRVKEQIKYNNVIIILTYLLTYNL